MLCATYSRSSAPNAMPFGKFGISATSSTAPASVVRATRPTPIFVRNGRVRVQDEIGAVLKPEVFCFIVGERPGLVTAESVSAYVIYRPSRRSAEPDRTVVSNIHRGGVAPVVAARRIADLIDEMLRRGASGAALAAARDSAGEVTP